MKVTLIPDRCIACGLCQTYSELFDYHDNGIVKFTEEDDLLEKEVPLTNDVLEAIRECPTHALLKD
ncbi:ferredoxin [Streptococcus parasanguinis]|jgi:ferredoxin|uniref:ferredoxin n=1 Tax=Streptococcus TaxID=1301 RepID=UPI0009B5DD4A|nr:ferredoxin [Streptococcus parasanguinis]MBF1716380.1 ferredoxin [Streptococcus parasanguinis]MCB6479044.1 ferredoxin [Streptococcus parasanguinis]MCB6703812.1 ferredoxin [Streptococcus parasanguinis]MCB6737558.1 ferredoxin [Streptococcus parasanguinis]MCB7321625.1 ferredoxin [Streptococcus parasanguinis]